MRQDRNFGMRNLKYGTEMQWEGSGYKMSNHIMSNHKMSKNKMSNSQNVESQNVEFT